MRGVHFVRCDGRTDKISLCTFFCYHVTWHTSLQESTSNTNICFVRPPVRRCMPNFFNKRYQCSNDVTTDSYKACWIINIVYLSLSPSRYSQSRRCSIAMDCTSYLISNGLVIWYERNTDALYFHFSIIYSYLQDVQHYYGSLRIVTIKITGHILKQPFPLQVFSAAFCNAIVQCRLQCFETSFPNIPLTLTFPTSLLSWHFYLFTGRVRVLDKLRGKKLNYSGVL